MANSSINISPKSRGGGKVFSGQVPALEPSRGLYVPEAAAEVSFSKHRMAHARDPERGGQHGMAIQPYFVEGVAS